MSHFTAEQLKELETRYGLKPLTNILPVRDGVVGENDLVWWRYAHGPKQVKANLHWTNIEEFPELYQLEEPSFSIQYKD